MVHIYTVGKDGYVQITKSELESLVKEAYDDGYKAGSRSTISIDTSSWDFRPYYTTSDTANLTTVKANKGIAVDNSTDLCKHTEQGFI